jgi:hypothetical protein
MCSGWCLEGAHHSHNLFKQKHSPRYMPESVERISEGDKVLAIIIRGKALQEMQEAGEEAFFATPGELPFQVAIHNRKAGFRYKSHITKPFVNVQDFTPNKIYYITSGKVGCDVYNDQKEKITYVELHQGDLILFTNGGHGVDIMEDGSFIEVKQGPYRGTEDDKVFLE